ERRQCPLLELMLCRPCQASSPKRIAPYPHQAVSRAHVILICQVPKIADDSKSLSLSHYSLTQSSDMISAASSICEDSAVPPNPDQREWNCTQINENGTAFYVCALCGVMSALGQKRTFAPQKGMSALPPRADMCGAARDVRFGPIADITGRLYQIMRRVQRARQFLREASRNRLAW